MEPALVGQCSDNGTAWSLVELRLNSQQGEEIPFWYITSTPDLRPKEFPIRRVSETLSIVTMWWAYDIDHSLVSSSEIRNKWRFIRLQVFTAVAMKNGVFWDITPQFILHRKHITSSLQSPAG
jgi:hypothetical protein